MFSVRNQRRCIVALALALTPWLAAAQDFRWTEDFKITGIFVSGAENFYFRASGMAPMPQCPMQPTWAFVNESDSGSKVRIAALMLAYASGKRVRVFVAPSNGYCRLLEVYVTD